MRCGRCEPRRRGRNGCCTPDKGGSPLLTSRRLLICTLTVGICATLVRPAFPEIRLATPAQPRLAQVAFELPVLGPGSGSGVVFVDAAKQASPWESALPLDLDRLGYPRSLALGQVAESTVYLDEPHPSGDFTLLYRGTGALDVDGGAIVARASGRVVVRIAAAARRVALRLSVTDPTDYIRDVHFVLPGYERTFASSPFSAQFVQSLRGVGTLRFSNWMHGATSNVSAVSLARPTTGAYTQAGPAGVAPEYIVALANAVGADAWLTLPAGATNGYVYATADVVRRRLDPRLRFMVEYGDQVWRAGTPSNAWATMAGRNLRLASELRQGALEWYALRSTQVFAVARRAFAGEDGRVVRVLSGPLDDPAALATILSYASALQRADAFFISPQAAPPGALRTLAVARLRTLLVGSLSAAIANGLRNRATRFVPNPALRFYPTAAIDEAVQSRRTAHPAKATPAPGIPNATPEPELRTAELVGELGDPLATVDLSREGDDDWIHWSGTLASPDRKAAAVAAITSVRLVGSGRAEREDAFAAYRWDDGATLHAERATHSGVAVSGTGNGFALSVPADKTVRVLRLYVGVHRAQGRFLAQLSDGSARPFADRSLDTHAVGRSGVYTLEYRAATNGARLSVQFTAVRTYAKGGGVAIEAATLARRDGARSNATPSDEVTFHNDILRSGWNPDEPYLTAQNVASAQFGVLETLSVDGVVLAQPLYLYQYAFPSQGKHNVLLVATENDTLYEFDADTFQLINSRNFGIAQNSGDVGCPDIEPTYGITSTPVIDRSTDMIYLVAATEPSPGTFVATVHAVDIGTLADVRTPTAISASVLMSNGSTIDFDPQNEQSRTSLVFANGALYVGIGSHCDNDAPNVVGWMLKYDANLDQVAAFPTAEDTEPFLLDGIWMGGYASAVDSKGNIFLVTGNGAFDAASGGADYGESALKFDPNLAGVLSSFTPTNWSQLNAGDADFGSGGIMLLPTQQTATPNIAVAMGKDSTLYLLDQDSLGGVGGSLQAIPTGGGGMWGGPAYFSGSKGQFVYYQTGEAPLVAYKVKSTKFGTTRLVQSSSGTNRAGYGGSSPVVSSNGQRRGSGVVWLVQRNATLTLQAYDAGNVGSMLFSGAAGTWGNPQNNGFVTPLVANGKVYVPAQGTVTVFGLQ